jgi:hypothetical protein
MKSVSNPLLRAFKHRIKISESYRDISMEEYIYRHILMHGSYIIKDRILKRVGDKDSLTFDVTYIFNDRPTDDEIVEALKKINAL